MEHLSTSPGASVTEIARAMDIHPSTADHHLRKLIRDGTVVARTLGRCRIHHVRNGRPCHLQVLWDRLNGRPHGRQAAMLLATYGRLTRKGLMAVGLSTSQARWAMDRLLEAGIAEEATEGALSLRPERITCLHRALRGEPCGGRRECAPL